MTLPAEMTIAVIDAAIHLPGIDNIRQFSQIITGDRPWSHFGQEIFNFPCRHFALSQYEATLWDPQLRHLLLGCEQLLNKNPRLDRHQLGLFVSSARSSYLEEILPRVFQNSPQDLPLLIENNDPTLYGAKVAYYLDIMGPVISANSMCSGGATALHLAMNSLIAGECLWAIVAASRLTLSDSDNSQARSGTIALLLTTRSVAAEQNLPILSLLYGSAMRNDGHHKSSFAAPNISAMQEAIDGALTAAELSAEQITYVEKAGSAMPLGRECEDTALKKYSLSAFGDTFSRLGDLDTVTALAQLLKGSCQNLSGRLPQGYWAINNFGIGGTNVHFIAGPAPQPWSDTSEKNNETNQENTFCRYMASTPGTTEITAKANPPTNLPTLLKNEISRLLECEITPEMEELTLSELGLDSYITLHLIERMKILSRQPPDVTIFAPQNSLRQILRDIEKKPLFSQDLPKAHYKLYTPDDYQQLYELFQGLSLADRKYFPPPLLEQDQLCPKSRLDNMLAGNKLIIILLLLDNCKIVGMSCYAENHPQLAYYQGTYKIHPLTIQDFHYNLPAWRGAKLERPDKYLFIREKHLADRLEGRPRSITLIVKPEIIKLQARLLAASIAPSMQEEELLYHELLAHRPEAIDLVYQFPRRPDWQARYQQLITGNRFGGILISELLQIDGNSRELAKLSAIIAPDCLFTLTDIRRMVNHGQASFAGFSFIHFEPLFFENIAGQPDT